jgi:hypothetical protein
LTDGGKAYAAECFADGATFADSVQAARHAEKRLADAEIETMRAAYMA